MHPWNCNAAIHRFQGEDIVSFLPGKGITGPYKAVNLPSKRIQHSFHADRAVIEGNDMNCHGQCTIVNPRPQINQRLTGTQDGCPNTNGLLLIICDLTCPGNGLFGLFDYLFFASL